MADDKKEMASPYQAHENGGTEVISQEESAKVLKTIEPPLGSEPEPKNTNGNIERIEPLTELPKR